MDTTDLTNEHLLFYSESMNIQDPEELLRFDRCRRRFEQRLEELGDPDKTAAFEPIVRWMHLFVSTMAPELLADEYISSE